ncbi:MAG: flagellar basal-body MS-ring/collar protein FliF [Candidatus Brocadiia bacterium]
MGFFQALGQQLGNSWSKLSVGHRVLLVLLAVLCVGAMVGLVSWAGTPEYEILCSDLSAKECAETVRALKDQGVPARMAEGGTAVLVPAGKLNEARMVAAEEGVSAGASMGFESFREPKIGMTPFAERINYVNALQNELATTITSLEPVVYARVHLVMPERELFARENKKPTASVMVVTRRGQSLSQRHAMAAANLVAAAVEGMDPQDVTITDGHGNVLSGGAEPGAQMAAADQLSYRRQVEEYLSGKAEGMLARVLGFDCCEVRVGVELEFKDSKETTRQYDPDRRVVVSERIESSKSSGSGSEVGGPVGSAGNVPGEQQAASSGGTESSSQTENIDTQYLVSESMRETVNRGASIKRLTVAALVDLSEDVDAAATGEERTGEQTQPAAGPNAEDISRIIKEAIGFDEARGDTLKIVEADFSPATAELAATGGAVPEWVMTAGQYFALGALGLVLLFVARKVLQGIDSASPRRVIIPEVVEGEGAEYPSGVNEDEIIRREIARFVEDNPEMAGRMIEGWVEGEE